MYICRCVCIYIYTYMYIYMYIYIYFFFPGHVSLSRAVACKPVYMCIYKYMYIYISVNIYILCVYIYCVYTYLSYFTKIVGLVQKWAPQNRLPLVGNFHGQSSDSPCAVALLPGHWHRCQAGLTWFWYRWEFYRSI